MSAARALDTLRAAGITVRLARGRLRLIPAKGQALPEEMIELARHYRDHLRHLLTPVGRCLDCRHGVASAGPDALAHCMAGWRGRLASAVMRCPDYSARRPT